LEQKAADPLYDFKRPINFYGKVVDEVGNPVPEAEAHFEWNALGESEQIQRTKTDIKSDSGGLFSLVGKRGNPLSVTVSKDGYYTSPAENLRSFQYAVPYEGLFLPDPANPVVFHLQRKGKPEPLLHGQKIFGFQINGDPRYLDLLRAKITRTPPGDLAVQFGRGGVGSGNRYDWSVVISVPEGGILETNAELMFIAPPDGYSPQIQIRYEAQDPDWAPQVRKQFFFRSRSGGIYGRAQATIIPYYQDNAAIDIDYYINPSGSRNLEYDPAQTVEPNK